MSRNTIIRRTAWFTIGVWLGFLSSGAAATPKQAWLFLIVSMVIMVGAMAIIEFIEEDA